MTNTSRQGRAREHLVRDDMADHGWLLVARSAGSKGPADLIMVSPDHGLALVQVGTGNKALGPADRDRLVTLADLCGALPILATVTRGRIDWWHVTRDVPSRWDRWSA